MKQAKPASAALRPPPELRKSRNSNSAHGGRPSPPAYSPVEREEGKQEESSRSVKGKGRELPNSASEAEPLEMVGIDTGSAAPPAASELRPAQALASAAEAAAVSPPPPLGTRAWFAHQTRNTALGQRPFEHYRSLVAAEEPHRLLNLLNTIEDEEPDLFPDQHPAGHSIQSTRVAAYLHLRRLDTSFEDTPHHLHQLSDVALGQLGEDVVHITALYPDFEPYAGLGNIVQTFIYDLLRKDEHAQIFPPTNETERLVQVVDAIILARDRATATSPAMYSGMPQSDFFKDIFEEADHMRATDKRLGLFGAEPRSPRRSEAVESVIRTLSAGIQSVKQKRSVNFGVINVTLATALVRLLRADAAESPEGPTALPRALSSLPQPNARRLLMLLAKTSDASLMPVVEGLRRRLEGGHWAQTAAGAGVAVDTLTMQEGFALIGYHLRYAQSAHAGKIPGARPGAEKQAIQSILKIFKDVLGSSAAKQAGLTSALADEIIRGARIDAKGIISSGSPRADVPIDPFTHMLVTLHLALVQLALRTRLPDLTASANQAFVHAMSSLRDSSGALLFDRETDDELSRQEQLLVDLTERVMRHQAEQPRGRNLVLVTKAIEELPAAVQLALSHDSLRNFIASCRTADAQNLAGRLWALRQAGSPDGVHVAFELGLSIDGQLDVLLEMARNAQREDAQRLLGAIELAGLTPAQSIKAIEALATAGLPVPKEIYEQVKLNVHTVSATKLLRIVKSLKEKESSLLRPIVRTWKKTARLSAWTHKELSHASEAAYIAGEDAFGLRCLDALSKRPEGFLFSDFATILRTIALRQPGSVISLVRSLLVSRDGSMPEHISPLLKHVAAAGSRLTPETILRQALFVLWRTSCVPELRQLVRLAKGRGMSLPPAGHPYRLWLALEREQPFFVATLFQRVLSAELLAKHYGIVNWMCKMYARGLTPSQATETLLGAAPRPNNLSLRGAFFLYRLLFEATAVVDRDTAKELMLQLSYQASQLADRQGGSIQRVRRECLEATDYVTASVEDARRITGGADIRLQAAPASAQDSGRLRSTALARRKNKDIFDIARTIDHTLGAL